MSNIEFRESELLLVSKIKESANNPRGAITDESLIELQESIKKVGLIQPILVKEKKTKKTNYEVVAGSRRFKACKNLNWDHIPAIIVSADDKEYHQIAIIENCQRMDMTPMEEFRAYKELQDENGMTPEEISDSIGKSIKYVYDRLCLDRISNVAAVLLHEGKINITQAKVLCMVNIYDQKQIIIKYAFRDGDTITGLQPAVKLREFIVSNVQQNLSSAVFDILDKKLLSRAGACRTCPKRTGSDLLLFEGFESDDICLDKLCFREKKIIHLDRIKDDYESRGIEVIKGTRLGWTEEDKEFNYSYVAKFTELIEEHKTAGFETERVMIIYNGSDAGKIIPILTIEQESSKIMHPSFASEDETMKSNRAYHKAIEKTIFKCAENHSKRKDDLLTMPIKRIIAWLMWNESDIETKRNISKIMDWKIKDGDKNLDHKELNLMNDKDFFDHNYHSLGLKESDQIISYMLFGNIKGSIINKKLIFDLAESLGIDIQKDILPGVNSEFETELTIDELLN